MAIDYVRAVGNQARSFPANDLRTAQFEAVGATKRPLGRTGANAVVFRADIGGEATALRFFTYMDDAVRKRYLALKEYRATSGLGDWLTSVTWMDDAIEVNGERWPAVRMDWVEGITLHAYTEQCVQAGDSAAIDQLAKQWRAMIVRMQEARFAHGDLQHNNVLVNSGGGLRLIDFDGVWLPRLAGLPAPTETGHPNYQRGDKQWNRWMDTFPGLVVYLSLTLLAREPELWHDLHTSESMLFAKDDLQPDCQTDVWRCLDRFGDPAITALANELRMCCQPGWSARGPLKTLLPPDEWWPTAKQRPPAVRGPSVRPIQRPRAAPVPAPPTGTWWGPTPQHGHRTGTTTPSPVPKTSAKPSRRTLVTLVSVGVAAFIIGVLIGHPAPMVISALAFVLAAVQRWRK